MKIIKWISYYLKRNPYLRLYSDIHGGGFIMNFDEAMSLITSEVIEEHNSGEDMGYGLELIWMTEYQKGHLPEFDGW